MDTYEVIITAGAQENLVELMDYIAFNLQSAGTARRYVRSIREEIAKLSFMPASFALVDEEPWHSRGIRKIRAKNSFVYFDVDEERLTVHVIGVVNVRRDQDMALGDMIDGN